MREIVTKRGERFHTEAPAVASFKAEKNGWGGTRQKPGGMHRHDSVSKRERQRGAEREMYIYCSSSAAQPKWVTDTSIFS